MEHNQGDGTHGKLKVEVARCYPIQLWVVKAVSRAVRMVMMMSPTRRRVCLEEEVMGS